MSKEKDNKKIVHVANGKRIERHHPNGRVQILGQPTTKSLAEAGARFWNALPSDDPNIHEAVQAWLSEYVCKCLNSASTAREYSSVMNDVILPRLAKSSAARCSKYRVRALRDRLRKAGLPPKRIAVALRTFSAFYGKAKAWGLTMTNPVADLDDLPMGSAPEGMREKTR